MKITYNINQPAMRVLTDAYYKKNKGRNRILTVSVVLTVILFFGIFSLTFGKINTDKVRNIRKNGMMTSAYLENGTKETEQIITQLSYVEKIGCEKLAGVLIQKEKEFCSCAVLDEIAYEQIVKLAYTDIHGAYPQKSNEIMMSRKSLEYLGITKPKIGMEISSEFEWYGMTQVNTGLQKFILSGYFQDYNNDISGKSIAYISKERLEESGINFYPLRILIEIKQDYMSGKQIEDALYRDVVLSKEDQQFVSIDSPQYKATENMLGGYGMSILFALLVLLSMFLLVYNVLFISHSQDIKQYGLLEIIGVTDKQIRKIIYWQSARVTFKGVIVGAVIGSLAVYFAMPPLLKKMYLNDVGSMEKIQIFSPQLLFVSIVFSALTMLFSAGLVVGKLRRLSPVEALRFEDFDISSRRQKVGKEPNEIIDKKSKVKEKKKGSSLSRMALRNIMRSKRKLFLTIFSIVLGCEVALCAVVVSKGTDIIHKLSENSDFEIGITKDALREFPFQDVVQVKAETIFDYSIFTDELISYVVKNAEIEESEIERTYGCFAGLDDVEESVYYTLTNKEKEAARKEASFEPIYRSNYGLWDGSRAGYYGIGIIQVVDDDYIKHLSEYVEEYKLDADLNMFEEKNGVIILHEHALSEEAEKTAIKSIGKPIYVYPTYVLYGQEDVYIEKAKLTNCGYLDISQKYIPLINRTWTGQDILYFIVDKKTFSQLDVLPKQTFQIRFDVEAEKEPEIKEVMKKWVELQNVEFRNEKSQDMDLFYINCNSNVLEEQKNYMEASRTIMGIISMALMVIGIMNYLNTITTGILSRKREFARMECIGMTRKQLRKMITLEGIFYWIFIVTFLMTVGMGILNFLGKVMKDQILYFKFVYPYSACSIIVLFLFIVCIAVPRIVYRQSNKDSSIEQLRKNE